jgi:hypothetical protein
LKPLLSIPFLKKLFLLPCLLTGAAFGAAPSSRSSSIDALFPHEVLLPPDCLKAFPKDLLESFKQQELVNNSPVFSQLEARILELLPELAKEPTDESFGRHWAAYVRLAAKCQPKTASLELSPLSRELVRLFQKRFPRPTIEAKNLIQQLAIGGGYTTAVEVAGTSWPNAPEQEVPALWRALVAARAASDQYFDILLATGLSEAGLSGANRSQLLARHSVTVSDAFDAALARAIDPYLRLQLVNEWWAVRIRPGFAGKPLRKMPWEVMHEAIDPADVRRLTDERSKSFETQFLTVLDTAKPGPSIQPQSRRALAAALAEEGSILGLGIVPKARYDQIVADTQLFCDFGLPLKQLQSPQVCAMTMRWYMWNAMVKPAPDAIDAKILTEQVTEFSRYFQATMDQTLDSDGYQPGGNDDARRLITFFHQTRGNLWFPYFKRALTPAQLRMAYQAVQRDGVNLRRQLESSISQLRARDREQKLANERNILEAVSKLPFINLRPATSCDSLTGERSRR